MFFIDAFDMKNPQKVHLFLETSRGFGRGLLRGIIRWIQLHDTHVLVGGARHFENGVSRISSRSNAGIIATLTSTKQCEIFAKTGLPIVVVEPAYDFLLENFTEVNASIVQVNSQEVAKRIANFFLGNGFTHFGYCGIPKSTWSKTREEVFASHVRSRGFPCEIYHCSHKSRNPFRSWNDSFHLAKWLRSLPKQTALMTCNDDRGRHVLEVCQQNGIPVPKYLSVMGVDDDDLICNLTIPPLSSIFLGTVKAGFQAMAHLNDLMENNDLKRKTIHVEPLYITERRSSDYYAFDDPVVYKAVHFIKNNFLYPISVPDVAKAADVSRRTLERRFCEVIKRSVGDEITERRFDRAKQLLLNTDYNISQISVSAGFSSLQQMIRAFHQKALCTPGEYRLKVGN